MVTYRVSVGQYFIFGALCPSKSGLMNKHIVKHIVKVKCSEVSRSETWCPTVPVSVRTTEQTYRETYRIKQTYRIVKHMVASPERSDAVWCIPGHF